MKLAVFCVIALSTLASSCLVREGPPARRDGNWKVTTETDLPGVSRKPPPITFMHCVTKEDAEDPAKLVPLTGRAQIETSSCKVADQILDGAKVSWTTLCEGTYPMTGIGEFVYGADQFFGTMKVTLSRKDAQPVTITMKYSGDRIGDCVEQAK